jgi:hypothetical protein
VNLQTARFLGAGAAFLCAAIYFAWQRLRGPECHGAVYIEIRPPLGAPGPYHFRLNLDEDERTCEFDVSPEARGVQPAHCGMALEIQSRVQGTHASIVGLTVGSAPEKLQFVVTRGTDVIYDAELVPKYAPYATTRKESRRFCGENAFLKPACRRGSPSCAPFSPACDGPEDCDHGKVCCVSPEWGFEYGARAATECTSKPRCLARLARFACHTDAHCPDGMLCNDPSLRSDFAPPLQACGENTRN